MAIQNRAIKHQHKASDKTRRIHRETWGRELSKENGWEKTDGKQCKLQNGDEGDMKEKKKRERNQDNSESLSNVR